MEEIMNTDKGAIADEPAKYRLIDLFADLAGRMHTYGPNAVIKFTGMGWHVEDRKAGLIERCLLGMVSELVEALRKYSPNTMVTVLDEYGNMRFG